MPRRSTPPLTPGSSSSSPTTVFSSATASSSATPATPSRGWSTTASRRRPCWLCEALPGQLLGCLHYLLEAVGAAPVIGRPSAHPLSYWGAVIRGPAPHSARSSTTSTLRLCMVAAIHEYHWLRVRPQRRWPSGPVKGCSFVQFPGGAGRSGRCVPDGWEPDCCRPPKEECW